MDNPELYESDPCEIIYATNAKRSGFIARYKDVIMEGNFLPKLSGNHEVNITNVTECSLSDASAYMKMIKESII